MEYPPWPLLPWTGGWVIGLIATVHVILAHAAIGGGFVFALAEQRSVPSPRRAAVVARISALLLVVLALLAAAATRSWTWVAIGIFVLALSENRPAVSARPRLEQLARRGTRLLIWVSVVFGALTGVWIWVSISTFSPAATSTLLNAFIWFWAAEWILFAVEIFAILLWDATWDRAPRAVHLVLAWTYAAAAWLSLVVINGMVSFMLTSGRWLETGNAWDGVLNPTYGPSLLLRSGLALVLGAGIGLIAVGRLERDARGGLTRFVAAWGLAGFALAASGYAWWQRVLDPSVQVLFAQKGQDLYGTWMLMHWGAALVLAAFLLAGLLPPRWMTTLAAAGVLAAACIPIASFERIREAVRKPYVVQGYMYSNGVRVADVGRLRARGFTSGAAWVGATRSATGEGLGSVLFRAQCAACHTIGGPLAIRPRVRDQDARTLDRMVLLLPQLDGRMPPFAGNARERAALAGYLAELGAAASAPTPASEPESAPAERTMPPW